jgi:hypothetical protein
MLPCAPAMCSSSSLESSLLATQSVLVGYRYLLTAPTNYSTLENSRVRSQMSNHQSTGTYLAYRYSRSSVRVQN